MTPAEHGEHIAAEWSPLTDAQVEALAKVLAAVEIGQVAA